MNRERLARLETRRQLPREVRFLTRAEQHVWIEGIVTCVMARPVDARTVAQVVGAEIDRWMANPLHKAILNVDAPKNQDQNALVQLVAPRSKILHELHTGREYAAGAVMQRSLTA